MDSGGSGSGGGREGGARERGSEGRREGDNETGVMTRGKAHALNRSIRAVLACFLVTACWAGGGDA